MNLLERYSGARPFSDLYMIVAVSLLMISFIFGHFRLCINGLVLFQFCINFTLVSKYFRQLSEIPPEGGIASIDG